MQQERPLLTISIPTYNRASFLRKLLSCLRDQWVAEPGVELIVSDNASTDETPAVSEEFRRQGLPLRYIRNQINIGSDANFVQCYEQANGKYVWVFGDDDLLLENGLSIVLDLLQREEPDFLFLAPYVFYNQIDEIVRNKRVVPTTVTTDPIKLVHLANLHADLILITAGIINKERVDSCDHPPFSALVGTYVVQLGWIFTALRYMRRGVFLRLGVLAARAGNARAGFHAARVFAESYRRAVIETLEPNSKLANKLLNDHMRMWFPTNWLSFRATGEDARNSNVVISRAFSGSPWYWICVFPMTSTPRRFARLCARVLRVPAQIQRYRLGIARE